MRRLGYDASVPASTSLSASQASPVVTRPFRSVRSSSPVFSRVVACLNNNHEAIAHGDPMLAICAVRDAVYHLRHDAHPLALIVDFVAFAPDDISLLLDALRSRAAPTPLAARFSINREELAIVLAHAARIGPLHLSARAVEPLDVAIATLQAGQTPTCASVPILARMGHVIPAPLFCVVCSAILAGRASVTVHQLATCCGIPVRTLQDRLQRHSQMAPKSLLMWTRVLHAIWRIEQHGFSIKHATAAGGWRSTRSLSLWLRHVDPLHTPGSGLPSFTHLIALLTNALLP